MNVLRTLGAICAVLFLLLLHSPSAAAMGTVETSVDSSSAAVGAAAGGGTDSVLQEQAQKSGAGALSNQVPESAKKSLNQLGIRSGNASSFTKFTPANLFRMAAGSAASAAKAPLRAVACVFGILLCCALLGTLKSTFGEQSLQGVFDLVAALCIATVILIPVSQCVSTAAQTIRDSSGFMVSFLPVFSSLAVASGHPASAVASESLLLALSNALSGISSSTFVPMVDLYLGFCVVGAVAPGVRIQGVAEFVRSIVSWALLLCLTIYVGILSVQGLIANAADNVSIKTAKFVVEGAVPVVGGAISDAVNTVISCAGLLKTATGAYAIVVFLFAFLPPLLECLIWMLAVDISLAAADILGIANLSGLFKAIREALKLLMALLAASALAMIVSIAVMLLLGMGN